MLDVCSMTVKYEKNCRNAVENLSFTLSSGQWLMVVGPNGAGKSTLIESIAQGIPYQGKVTIDGVDLRTMKQRDIARKIGVLSQRNSVAYDYTVEEIVRLGRYAYSTPFSGKKGDSNGEEMVEKSLSEVGMAEKRHVSSTKLSGGEMQRMFLAQVLAQDPEILMLDEPTNHLDINYQQQLFDIIVHWLNDGKSTKRAVLSVVHDLSIAKKYATHGLLMSDGKCFSQGKIDEVMTPVNLDMVYGMNVGEWMRGMLEQWK